MKAPEKLYITNDEKRFSDKCHSASTEKYVDNDIEYTRTDAFIEKACEFLKSYRQYTPDGTGYIAGIINYKTIDDFVNYMKGE